MRRLSSEQGHTLVEMLVAALIGMIILAAIFMLVDTGTRTSARTADRIETAARTRAGTELIRARLRTAVCPPGGVPALVEAQDTRITFFSQIAERPAGVTLPEPAYQQRTLLLQDGAVVEEVYDTTAGTGGVPVPGATPVQTNRLVEQVEPAPGRPLFEYHDAAGAVIADPGRRQSSARVRVQLVGRPSRPETALAAPSDTTVLLRTDDPTDADTEPQC